MSPRWLTRPAEVPRLESPLLTEQGGEPLCIVRGPHAGIVVEVDVDVALRPSAMPTFDARRPSGESGLFVAAHV